MWRAEAGALVEPSLCLRHCYLFTIVDLLRFRRVSLSTLAATATIGLLPRALVVPLIAFIDLMHTSVRGSFHVQWKLIKECKTVFCFARSVFCIILENKCVRSSCIVCILPSYSHISLHLHLPLGNSLYSFHSRLFFPHRRSL